MNTTAGTDARPLPSAPRTSLVVACLLIVLLPLLILSLRESRELSCAQYSIRIEDSPLLHPLRGSERVMAVISLRSTNRVSFFQNAFKCPLLVLPSDNPDALFCIYDKDVDWQILRIYPDQPRQSKFTPVESAMVLDATCRIERVHPRETNALLFVVERVKEMSEKEFQNRKLVKLMRGRRDDLITDLRHSIGDLRYPED